MPDAVAEGGCLCGAVRYRTEGSPIGSTICQETRARASGAPSVAWDPEAFPPSYHAWVGDGPRWARRADGLPAFERAKPT